MAGEVKSIIQGIANRLGYHIRRQDPGIDLIDPYKEQQRILGKGINAIFEIGAADGRDCLRYLELFPQARVYAFEPLPKSFESVKQKAAVCPRISAFNVAMSDQSGSAIFHVSDWVDASSLLRQKITGSTFDAYQASSKSITVTVDTIDNFCSRESVEHIDLLKMDAQGAELMILDGGAQALRRAAIDMIFTEVQFLVSYEGAARFDEIMARLSYHRFHLHSLYGIIHNHRGQMLWGDALFVHERIVY